MHRISLKTKIYSGSGSLSALSAYKNTKIFLICDEFLLASGGVRQLLQAIDNSCQVKIFHEVVPDPPISAAAKALVAFQRFAPQVLIAMGGGSAIDTAKGVLYLARQMPGAVTAKLIAVPTTSGTGSEVTSVTVLTDSESQRKHVISEERIVPDAAILDPYLTLSVPPAITANTGMDSLTHALEAYVATGSTHFSDALAEKAVELIASSLLTCYRSGSDPDARTKMQEASTFAGIAFDQAGLGLAHSLAHQLGGVFHIPHGMANALVLKEVILFNSTVPSIRFKYADLAKRTGISYGEKSEESALQDLLDYIEDLKLQMKLPALVTECGVSRKQFEDSLELLVEHTLNDWCILSNPTKIAAESVNKILKSLC